MSIVPGGDDEPGVIETSVSADEDAFVGVTEGVMMDLDGDGSVDAVTIERTTIVDVDGDEIVVVEIEEFEVGEASDGEA